MKFQVIKPGLKDVSYYSSKKVSTGDYFKVAPAFIEKAKRNTDLRVKLPFFLEYFHANEIRN